MHCLKLPQVANMVSCAQLKKMKTIKKHNDTDDGGNRIFCSGQSCTDSVYTGTVDSVKAIDVVPR
jgi:hypothetical protein